MANLRRALFMFAAAAALVPASAVEPAVTEAALELDDQCSSGQGENCALNALQLKAKAAGDVAQDAAADDSDEDNGGDPSPIDDSEVPEAVLGASSWHGWAQGGDKMWGAGSGMEVINVGNVGYYDKGMYAARNHCGDAGCALLTNPPGHRTKNQFHIHFVHYQGYGRSLKSRLEGKVCGAPGVWHSGGLPCHGRAAFFTGFPGVFSKAMTSGGIGSASVIAWPGSCGGRGTIVELAYGCSIEHQIRGDFDPSRR